MRDLISDFNSMKAIPNSIPKNGIPTPIPIQMMAIPIQFQFRLDWVKPIPIPIPELDLELARKSNSGAELTPTLYPISGPLIILLRDSFSYNIYRPYLADYE